MSTQYNLPSSQAIERSLAGTPSPLAAVVTTSSLERVQPGQSHHIGVTVSNLGQKSAVISAYINEQNPILRQWCLGLEQRLALGPGQSGEVFFRFQIPPDAIANLYEYDLIIDSPEHYATTILRYAHRQIQVLPPSRNQATAQDPTFGIETPSTPETPLPLQPGVATLVQVFVENRTERVDRYRLQCTGLPADWTVKVQYPANLAGVGLVTEADSLGLNPGERGQLQVLIQSPTAATAGSYIPTLQLSSENQPDLGLLDLVYLEIAPIYLLQPQLQVQQNQVNGAPATFEIQILNSGNTDRHLTLAIQSPEDPQHCIYKLARTELHLHPQSVAQVSLQASPQPRWRRPWLGSGRLYNFQVLLADQEQRPLNPPSLPGYFTWVARPGWQLLLTALLLLGTVAGIAGLIWWLFLRAPAPSQVQEFAAEDAQYSETADEAARVRWVINNPEQLRSLQLTGLSPEGEVLSGPLSYDFTSLELEKGALPKSLASHCRLSDTELACRNVPTDARKPGQYIFELALTSRKKGKAFALQSKPVTILAKPLPRVEAFQPAALLYQEANAVFADANAAPLPPDGIPLQWSISHPQDLQGLKLSVRDQEAVLMGELFFSMERDQAGNPSLPAPLKPYCVVQAALICKNVPTGIYDLGTYQFELTPIPFTRTDITLASDATTEHVVASSKTEAVTIQPQSAFIADFRVNGDDALSRSYHRFLVERRDFPDFPTVPISWNILGGSTTQVELLPGPGTVPLEGEILLPLQQQYGVTTVTLRVTDGTGQTISRAVSLEAVDPFPVDPAEVAAMAAIAAAETAAEVNAASLRALQQQQAMQQQLQLEQQWALQQQLLEQTAPPPASTLDGPSSVAPTAGGAELLQPRAAEQPGIFRPRSDPDSSEQLTPAESQPIFQ